MTHRAVYEYVNYSTRLPRQKRNQINETEFEPIQFLRTWFSIDLATETKHREKNKNTRRGPLYARQFNLLMLAVAVERKRQKTASLVSKSISHGS